MARKQRKRSRQSGEQGFILLLAVVMVVICSVIGVAAVSMTGLELKIAGSDHQRRMSFNAAEAGLSYALNQLPDTDKFPKTSGDTCCDLDNGSRFHSSRMGQPAEMIMPFKQSTLHGSSQNFKFNWYRASITGRGQNDIGSATVEADIRYGPVPNTTNYGGATGGT